MEPFNPDLLRELQEISARHKLFEQDCELCGSSGRAQSADAMAAIGVHVDDPCAGCEGCGKAWTYDKEGRSMPRLAPADLRKLG